MYGMAFLYNIPAAALLALAFSRRGFMRRIGVWVCMIHTYMWYARVTLHAPASRRCGFMSRNVVLVWNASFILPPALPTGALQVPAFGRSAYCTYMLLFVLFGLPAVLYILCGLPAVALHAHDFRRCG